MIRLAAIYPSCSRKLPFLKRFEAAARAGFRAVEFSFAYDVATGVLRSQLRDNDPDPGLGQYTGWRHGGR